MKVFYSLVAGLGLLVFAIPAGILILGSKPPVPAGVALVGLGFGVAALVKLIEKSKEDSRGNFVRTSGLSGSETCEKCNGSGEIKCAFCKGTGIAVHFKNSSDYRGTDYGCPICPSHGKRKGMINCPTCEGSGRR